MMKKIHLIVALLAICIAANAQSFMRFESKRFNYGAKIGFNATFPVINSLSINNNEAENINVEYKVGYLAAVFCRFNLNKLFLQPSISWHRSEGNINFSMPKSIPSGLTSPNDTKPSNMLNMKTSSLEMPLIIGYNLIKEGPFGLSLMAGPKFKYNYNISYTVESPSTQVEYINDNTPFGINIATGVGVSIGRLFFDFVYEFGLNQVESDFKKANNTVPEINYDINIDKRTNVMSMSLGFLF